jgi:hypothetical protein
MAIGPVNAAPESKATDEMATPESLQIFPDVLLNVKIWFVVADAGPCTNDDTWELCTT